MIYPFSSYLYKDEAKVVQELLNMLDWDDVLSDDVRGYAVDLVNKTRSQKGRGGQLESFLQEFSLNTDEGLAMMCLAEALLRIPDTKTANALIRDKVAAANWLQKQGGGKSKDWLSKAAGVGMSLARKTLDSALSHLGEPVIREAMIRAMQMMGKQFVLGTSIDDALSHARAYERQGYRMSYDMLGEGARSQEMADQYLKAYMSSINSIALKNNNSDLKKAGISVKLSALHPRYTYAQKYKCIPEISDKLKKLCIQAAAHDMPLTIDAEEANRLDISIEIIEEILNLKELDGWDGFGLAVQAYQKRALPLINYMADRARKANRKIQIRLVKGAYWDSEIKHAQINGFPEYPVFTRKSNTDISFLACAQAMFSHSDVIYPMFATHNAHTIASIKFMAARIGDVKFEFQRLHGMGESLYAYILDDKDISISVYAPVGPHKDLLPYLVRRLLENGANSSFVNQLLDNDIAAINTVRDPVEQVRRHKKIRHPAIPLPQDIFGDARRNSKGIDLDDPISSQGLLDYIENYKSPMLANSLINGEVIADISHHHIEQSFLAAGHGFKLWNQKDVQERYDVINRFSDLLEGNSQELLAILVYEAGKTINDARDELREAVDFCRYYADLAQKYFDKDGTLMSGYTGETNRLTLEGRGIFICISPWNFPLAIFTGQIIAALVSGNAVLAKPASQTRYIAMRCVELMHEAGIPHDALHLLLGDGTYGSKIVAHKDVSGVVFTGSTATAKHIQQIIAVHNDAIIPFIAETGGQNAMIVDSSSLPEQVVDDVIISAFGSAGQRCSALRVLYLQNDIADDVIYILKGAMDELVVSDPSYISSDIGPVIDNCAKALLEKHLEYMDINASLIHRVNISTDLSNNSLLFAPSAYEIEHIDVLKGEVFGGVLHIIRYDANDIDDVIKQINGTGYGLTCGVHSRVNSSQVKIAASINAGNIYVNRSMTGAVVGVQPFGGMGSSGTGPKAGGPHYLYAFAVEKVVTTDTTASGGNASLISLTDAIE